MPVNRKPPKLKDDWVRYGSIGTEMLASVLVGALGGYGLDRLLHTEPWLLIVGFIFGSAAGFRRLFRLLDQDNKKDRNESNAPRSNRRDGTGGA